MPKPWEMTLEGIEREAERLRARFEEADRIAAPLLARNLDAAAGDVQPCAEGSSDDASDWPVPNDPEGDD
ncbi:MAG: hypothetical protein HY909_15885 [Deltaproteobacteria bacterium]|nr:hypothetical protein [Deltaproteobacteria bacterium]